jgi:hypothetical protein
MQRLALPRSSASHQWRKANGWRRQRGVAKYLGEAVLAQLSRKLSRQRKHRAALWPAISMAYLAWRKWRLAMAEMKVIYSMCLSKYWLSGSRNQCNGG